MAEIAGLKLITPSSVAGSGVSLSGAKVVFTAATSVSVNGVFDGTHDNYLLVMRATISTGQPNFRLRAAGSDATGNNCAFQHLNADSTTVSGVRLSSVDFINIGINGSSIGAGAHVYVYGPALAQPTALRSVTAGTDSSARILDSAGTHSASTSYDGFTLSRTTGNMTGALTVYGLSQ